MAVPHFQIRKSSFGSVFFPIKRSLTYSGEPVPLVFFFGLLPNTRRGNGKNYSNAFGKTVPGFAAQWALNIA